MPNIQNPDVGLETLLELGALGEDARDRFAVRWDKRDEYVPRDEHDCGWVGEDAEGLWAVRHPAAMLCEHPGLWPIVNEWWCGIHEIRAEDYEHKSNFEFTGKLVMASAHSREEKRRNERMREGDDG